MKSEKNYPAFILLILIQSFLLRLEAQQIIDVRDFGVKPWSYENASPAIVKAINESQGRKDVVHNLSLDTEFKYNHITNATNFDSLSEFIEYRAI